MNRRIVVTAGECGIVETGSDDLGRKMAQHLVIRGPGEGHNTAVIGRYCGLVEADVAKIVAQFTMTADGFILLQEADAVLRDKDPASIQAAFAAFVER